MSYGGYNNGGGQSSYAGRSAAQRSPTSAAKKHMLKLVILGDSG